MTSHELAHKLLSLPDNTIGFMEYAGGDDEYREVKGIDADYFEGIMLMSYDPEK